MEKELEDLRKILDSDEMVLESYKPNKKRFVTLQILFSGSFFLLLVSIMFVIGILGLVDVIRFTDVDGNKEWLPPIMLTAMGAFPLLFYITGTLGIIFRYKRSLYVITNKRFIIRSGFIGVDYKSLEIKNVLTVDVRVDFLDKLVKPNTGSIIFGSAAMPVINGNGSRQQGAFSFAHINEPYEVYKKVKEHLN